MRFDERCPVPGPRSRQEQHDDDEYCSPERRTPSLLGHSRRGRKNGVTPSANMISVHRIRPTRYFFLHPPRRCFWLTTSVVTPSRHESPIDEVKHEFITTTKQFRLWKQLFFGHWISSLEGGHYQPHHSRSNDSI